MLARKTFTTLTLVAVAAVTISFSASATQVRDPNKNLLLNGSFETGDFSEWQTSNLTEYDIPRIYGPGFRDQFAAAILTPDYGAGFWQFFPTIAGEKYQLRFAVKYNSSYAACDLFYGDYTCDQYDVSVGSQYINRSGKELLNGRQDQWQTKIIRFEANGNGTGVFVSANDPFGYFEFDDFRVALASANVPEPSSWLMMCSAFGLIGALMRRQRRVSTVGQQL